MNTYSHIKTAFTFRNAVFFEFINQEGMIYIKKKFRLYKEELWN